MPSALQEVKNALRTLGLRPRKRLAQHFMVNEKALSLIVSALEIKEGEMVLEIGPGLGFLTRRLLAGGAKVLAVEKDWLLAEYLSSDFQVIQKDILKLDLSKDLNWVEPVKVAGNIPYNITSPILEWLIGQRRLVSAAVLTVQKEVAERLTAAPGTKAWGPLSVFVQFHSRVSLVGKIGKADFYPPPKVDSAVVKIAFEREPRFNVNADAFFPLVRSAFQKRRKTLLNALASEALPKPLLLAAFGKAGIDPIRRPETLSIQEWVTLTHLC